MRTKLDDYLLLSYKVKSYNNSNINLLNAQEMKQPIVYKIESNLHVQSIICSSALMFLTNAYA